MKMFLKKQSLIVPSLAFLFVAAFTILAVGYLINYSILRDVLQERVETRADLITSKIQDELTVKIRRASQVKDSWRTSMSWLAQDLQDSIGNTGDIDAFNKEWKRLGSFFPYWQLDFLLVVDNSGTVTHRFPESLPDDIRFTQERLSKAVEMTERESYWFTVSPVGKHWSIQGFMRTRVTKTEVRLIVLGFYLEKIAGQLQNEYPDNHFLLASKDSVIGDEQLPEYSQIEKEKILGSIQKRLPQYTFDDKREWNFYYTPIQVIDKTLSLIVPISLESTRQILDNSRKRLLFSGLVIIFILIVAALSMNMFVLAPLRRLRGNAAALVNACTPRETDADLDIPAKGNEIIILEQALKVSSSKLYKDIVRLRESNELLEGLALKDPVTGLLNERMFFELLHRSLLECQRKGRKLVVLVLELSGLKQTSSNLHHETVEQLLTEFVERLRENIRGEDLAFRIGDHEFGAFIPECCEQEHLFSIARRMEHSFKQPYELSDGRHSFAVKTGISQFPEHGAYAEILVENAHHALNLIQETDTEQFKLFPGAQKHP